jgi:hypothetical protein
MTEDTFSENLRKFLDSDNHVLASRISMAKDMDVKIKAKK